MLAASSDEEQLCAGEQLATELLDATLGSPFPLLPHVSIASSHYRMAFSHVHTVVPRCVALCRAMLVFFVLFCALM